MRAVVNVFAFNFKINLPLYDDHDLINNLILIESNYSCAVRLFRSMIRARL